VKMTCEADGVPTPTLSWKNPSGTVIKQVVDLINTVGVAMRSDQDFGNYTCEATNDVNTDTSTLLVQQISKLNIYCSSIVFYDTHTHLQLGKLSLPSVILSCAHQLNISPVHLKCAFKGALYS